MIQRAAVSIRDIPQSVIDAAGPNSPLRQLAIARSRPRQREFQEQKQLFDWADNPATRLRTPDVEWLMHVPNGGKRTKAVAAKLKATGVRAGYPDLVLDVARGRFHGWRGELKVRGGRSSPVQSKWHERLRSTGYRVDVVIGWEAMRDKILDYLSLPLPWEVSDSPPEAARTVMLTCHAEHPDRRKQRSACGRHVYVGAITAAVEFVTTSSQAPDGPEADGSFWLQCSRRECRRWNRFRFIVPTPRPIV